MQNFDTPKICTAAPEPEELEELGQAGVRLTRWKPTDVLREFEQGSPIEALAGRVHRSGLFRTKTLSADYVRRCLYEQAQRSEE